MKNFFKKLFRIKSKAEKFYDAFSKKSENKRYKKFDSLLTKEIYKKIYEDTLFKFIKIRELKQGEINKILKKEEKISITNNKDDKKIEVIKKGTKIFPIEYFETVISNVDMSEISKRQFDIRDRIIDKTSYTFIKNIGQDWVKLLFEAASISGNIINFDKKKHKKSENYIIEFLKEGMITVSEEKNYVFIMSKRTFDNLFELAYKLNDTVFLQDLKKGKIFNCSIVIDFYCLYDPDKVINNPIIPDDIIIFLPETPVTEMNLRIPLCFMPANLFTFGEFKYGFMFGQMQSLTIPDCSKVSIMKL